MRALMLRPAFAAALLLSLAASGDGASAADPSATIGDPQRGARLISQIGCGSCHTIPGIEGARGKVGPPLGTIGVRVIIAGMLPNTPENLKRWIMAPQSVVPGNAMPDMGLSEHDAQDIAAYLYTLR